MRVIFELEVNDDELQREWREEVKNIAKHYFKEGVGASLLVDAPPSEPENQYTFELETEEFAKI